jgi:hypothetical protein
MNRTVRFLCLASTKRELLTKMQLRQDRGEAQPVRLRSIHSRISLPAWGDPSDFPVLERYLVNKVENAFHFVGKWNTLLLPITKNILSC